MKNGQKDFAPETALGTGAAEPVVSEYEAAKEVPTVDESLVKDGGSNNQPGHETIAYSQDDVAEPTSDEKSTGEDYETRHADDDTVAGSAVVKDDPEVNKPAEEVRPEVPQATKATWKSKNTV